jgi:hypothetical protein
MTDPLATLRAQRLLLLDALRKATTHNERCRLQDELNKLEKSMRGESDGRADE